MSRIARRGSIAAAGKVVVPVAFGAVGAGTGGSGTSRSELHTVGAGSNRAILAFINTHTDGAGATRPSISMTCGGVAMTELGTIAYFNSGGLFETVTAFGLLNPATGSQSVVATIGATVQAALNSVSYDNVGSFGSVVTNFATSSSASLSVPSAVGQMVSMAFSDFTTTFSSFNQTSRWNRAWSSGVNVSMVIGDAAGVATVGFSATAGNAFGAIGVPLIPA